MRTYLCSPFANFPAAVEYARICMIDSIKRGEAPFVPHLLYPAILPDEGAARELGMKLGEAWLAKADALAAYDDFGISEGMGREMKLAAERGIPVFRRSLLVGTSIVEPWRKVG